MKFEQEIYKDDNGRDISASEIQVLGAIKYGVDGFYHWWCGACENEHGSRSCGWPIAGQVISCYSCKKKNLLVRTDTDYVNELCKRKYESMERDKEYERLKGIEKYNQDQIREVAWKMVNASKDAITTLMNKEMYK